MNTVLATAASYKQLLHGPHGGMAAAAAAGGAGPAGAAAAAAGAAGGGAVAVPFALLFWWATVPVVKVFLMGLVGAVLARQGVLSADGRRTLSRLIFVLFTPCLAFDKMAPVLSASNLLRWLPLPANQVTSIAVGLALGAALSRAAPPWFRRHTVAATGLGNAGNLPLVLVAALVHEAGPALGKGASVEVAVAYVALCIVVANVSHFTIGLKLLRAPDAPVEPPDAPLEGGPCAADACCGRGPGGSGGRGVVEDAADAARRIDSYQKLLQHGSVPWQPRHEQQQQQQQQQQQRQQPQQQQRQRPAGAEGAAAAQPRPVDSSRGGGGGGAAGRGAHAATGDSGAAAAGLDDQGETTALLAAQVGSCDASVAVGAWEAGAPRAGRGGRGGLSGGGGNNGRGGVGGAPEAFGISIPPPPGAAGAGKGARSGTPPPGRHRARARLAACWEGCRELVSPPLVSTFLAMAVGMSPPLRDALFAPNAKLEMLRDIISMFGDCCIPSLMLMVGATLERGPGRGRLPPRLIAGVAAARLVALPLLGIGWALAARGAGLLPASTPRLLVLVALLQNAVPTALNVHTLCTLNANREAEMGALIFYEYLAACVTVPLFLALFLHVTQLYFG